MIQNENLLDLVNAIYRWRKPIIISCILAAVISSLVSLALPNYFRSTTVFYAASPDLANPLPVGSTETKRNIYGSDTDLDRLFSIANSAELSDYLIEEFKLFEKYEIDPQSDKAQYAVRLMLAKAYNTEKNKYDALELSVEDKDPGMATAMAKAARERINELGQQVIKGSQAKLLTNYKSAIDSKEKVRKNTLDTLSFLRKKFKIYNARAQGESLGEQVSSVEGQYFAAQSKLDAFKKSTVYRDSVDLVQAKVSGLKRQLDKLNEMGSNYTVGAGAIEKLEQEAKEFGEQLAMDKERYKQLKSAYESPFSALLLVQEAEIPVIKSRPVRSVIVMATTALTFFLGLIWAIFMNQYKNVNWRSVFSDEPRS